MNWKRLERTALVIHRAVYRVGFKIYPPHKHNPRRARAAIEWPVLAVMRLSGRVWFWTWKRARWELAGRFLDGREYDEPQ